jgi:hypothetical protein
MNKSSMVHKLLWQDQLNLNINKHVSDGLATRLLGWASIRQYTLMSTKTYMEILDEKTKWTKREKRKNTYSQTSRLDHPEELQLHHNHEKFLFLTVLLLFAQCKMHYLWLVSWLDLTCGCEDRPSLQVTQNWGRTLKKAQRKVYLL